MARPNAHELLITTTAGIAFMLVTCPAQAAAAAPAGSAAPETESGSSSGLEEIVVTARRREENAQTVPVTISAFSAQALANAGVQSTNDLQMLVPGIILNGAGSDANTTYTIRGQGKAVIGPGLPSVISYFDEVPLNTWGSVLPTFDVSNAQVLKGPQGTLFGRNTTGGAVLVYSTLPSFTLNGYLQAEFGNFDDRNFQGAINLPLIQDKLAIRLAGDIERRNGYTTNLLSGQKDDNIDSNAFRVSVLFRPLDWLSDSLVYDYYKGSGRTSLTALRPVLNPALLPSVAAAQPNGPYTFDSIVPSVNSNKIWGITNTSKAEFDSFSIKNIFGYRSTDIYDSDGDTGLGSVPLPLTVPALGLTAGTPGVLIDTVTAHVDRQFSDEIQFSGSAFGKALTWLVGGFYLYDEPNGPDYLVEDVFRPTTPSATTSFIVGNFLGGIWPLGSVADNLYTDRSKALFGNLSYNLSNLFSPLTGVTLNAGYRYTWDTEGVCANSRPGVDLATGQSVVPPYQTLAECRADQGGFVNSPANPYGPSFSQAESSSAPTYTLGVDYQLNDDVFLYFTTRRGYRTGGLNSPSFVGTVLAPFQGFSPQTVTDYEAGAHTNWSIGDVKGRFNIAVFSGKYKNLQLQANGITAGLLPGLTAENAPTNTAVTFNGGSATISGLDISGAIAPISDLVINYGASYLNPKYDSLNVPPTLSAFFSSGPFSGAPRWSYSADGRYHLPLPSAIGSFYLGAEYYHVSRIFEGFAPFPAYSLTNLTLQWANIADTNLDATLFANNVSNTQYIHNALLSSASFGVYSGDYGPPRMYGIRLRYAFGK
jgi:iron complex outermembrane receptor protein